MFIKLASTNLVPAVAVIRGMRVLLSIIGRKVYQGGFFNFILNIIVRTIIGYFIKKLRVYIKFTVFVK